MEDTILIAQSSGETGIGIGILLLGMLFLVAAYFIPTIVGAIRKVPNLGSVIVVNVFLGWTFIGWVVSLAMAARSQSPPPSSVILHPGQPPVPPRS